MQLPHVDGQKPRVTTFGQNAKINTAGSNSEFADSND